MYLESASRFKNITMKIENLFCVGPGAGGDPSSQFPAPALWCLVSPGVVTSEHDGCRDIGRCLE